MPIWQPSVFLSAIAAFAESAGATLPVDGVPAKRAADPGVSRIERSFTLAGVLLLSLSASATLGAPACDEASTISASNLRHARMLHNSMNHPTGDDKCHKLVRQFVEAVEARQSTATCQDSVARQRSLEILDGEIQTFNAQIAEQSCNP